MDYLNVLNTVDGTHVQGHGPKKDQQSFVICILSCFFVISMLTLESFRGCFNLCKGQILCMNTHILVGYFKVLLLRIDYR